MVKFDPYKILELTPAATQEEVKRAYRRLAKRFHPDSHHEGADHDRITQINAAYEVLGDPRQRQGYDRQRQGQPARNRQTRTAAPNNRAKPPSRVSKNIDSHFDAWLKQVYTPVNRRLGVIIKQLKPAIAKLSKDPFDDELMEEFQSYLEDCQASLEAAKAKFQSMPNPANVASIAANIYYCLTHLEDGVEELERFTTCYDDHYLNTGRELFRISAQLRREAQEAIKVVL
ncbi:MAG: DnaJ domain-containing protein [Thermosynechococcaceae cyanobacterium]